MNRVRESHAHSWRRRLIAAIMSVAAPAVAWPAQAEGPDDIQCGKGDEARRIEIRFEDETDQLPCRVIYRPADESETVGTVSWRGLTSLASCEAQAGNVVDRLTNEGWDCVADALPEEVGTDALPEAVETELRPEEVETEVRIIEAAVLPDSDIPADTTDNEQASEQAEEVEQPAEQADDPSEQPPTERGFDDPDMPAVLLDNPDIEAPSPALSATVSSDLAMLDQTLDGMLEARIAAYDDLNADGLVDALVIVTYASPKPAYRQFLAAYLFDGEAYQLTSTKPIADSAKDTSDATVDFIKEGTIELSLKAYEPGDDFCCPSGMRRMSLALRDLTLIEIDQDVPRR